MGEQEMMNNKEKNLIFVFLDLRHVIEKKNK
jgi:hypothetical protein